MKKLLMILALVWAPLVYSQESEYTYEELLDDIDLDAPMRVRIAHGIIREIDLSGRSIVIGGYSYLVGPSYAERPVVVELYGTSAGSFELLTTGMPVEVIYIDFEDARIAFEIKEVGDEIEVEH